MSILVKPHITEKSSLLSQKRKYIFIVKKESNKIEIKKEIEKRYNVVIEGISTALYLGKKVTRHTKRAVNKGQRNFYKKAIITLRQGDEISIVNP